MMINDWKGALKSDVGAYFARKSVKNFSSNVRSTVVTKGCSASDNGISAEESLEDESCLPKDL